jgi:hypothetical protein
MLSTVHDSTTVSIATPMSTPSRSGGILGREMPAVARCDLAQPKADSW